MMKKTDLIQKLKQLQGISDDERAYLINLVNTKKKYGLVWEEKPEDVEEQLRENLPVLKEVKDRAIINGEEYPNHILIEGDNLHALTALTFTHEGKIDVIYIDPPYNTGNKDFIYNDTFVDVEDNFRHSKWLSFMSKRLQNAKRLLNENGVIFISIDDNEAAQLKLLCNEVFGENNFITQFLWEKTSTPPALSKKVRKKMEYVICYEKSKDNSSYSIGKVDGGDVPLLNSGNATGQLIFPEGSIKFNIPDGVYSNTPERKVRIIGENLIVQNSLNANSIVLEGNFKWKQEMLNKEILLGTHFIIKSELFSIRFQRKEDNLKTKTPTNRLDKELNVGTNEDAKKEIEDLSINYFDYPKPVSLIKLLTNLKYNSNSIILDFFAGSGTTLHATMLLNAEDGGSRQCILVTNNENNICEEVTYERSKRVIQGYTNAKGEKVEGLSGNNLRYYKSEFVGREPSVKNKKEITRLATELLCIKEDIYAEQKQLGDYQLNATYVRCFQQGSLYLLVIYDEDVIEQMVEVIQSVVEADADRNSHFKVYVFSNGQYPYTEEFEEVLPYITLCALPDAIYKAYQNVLPKRQRQQVPELEEPTAEEVEKSLEHDVKDVQDKQDKKQGNLFNT
ncbi:adenine-specific DNA-methyltransferase [Chitinophaga terrae (ex Kim and Jung 2007)]|uniref:site-specific DNA-methyltransferase n=1 Tax=Chitinophaga terrae (ex Kim and Jung 2007) TaxID=408074 RepID=UPI0027813DD4|nr:site-specific DNA-methyltransferase [Chitinophaga terrae (ex Kim and Jung 2007)]MDQ0105795.1 adenine-specific DNA-methyltransferase [Chitinophaga terrae (ex Kim and Jung 2007)]